MKKGIIYKITNIKNNKSYIGQTIRKLSDRKSGHKHGMNSGVKYILYESMRKYGWNCFIWEVLEKPNVEKLDDREKYYIKKYNTLKPNGYNMTLNTCGYLGFDFSGKNNPRYNDHRTWEELHGKEKSDILKKQYSDMVKDASHNIIYWKRNNPDYNPMNDPKHRETLSKIRIGGNNPMAIYNFIFNLPDGTIYETDCLRKFCRETGFARHTLTRICSIKNYNPKDKFYKNWICKKMLKENCIEE